jgi:hypothetical protein
MKQNRLRAGTIFLACIFSIFYSCTYDQVEVPCGKQQYTYKDVDPFFQQYGCTSCHDGSPEGTLPNLSDSTAIRNYIKTNRQNFEGSVDFTGAKPMPRKFSAPAETGEKMPDSCITMIKAWICQGAK